VQVAEFCGTRYDGERFWLLLIFCGTGGMMLESSALVESMNFVPTLPQLGPIKTKGAAAAAISLVRESERCRADLE
jgi:hypothetical protein